MLVTFRTNAYSDITMFGTAATALLKLMGQSGNVPGAIMSDDVPEALRQLNEGLKKISAEQLAPVQQAESSEGQGDGDEEEPIGLDRRAGPLIALLEAAIASSENVLWNE